MSKFTSRQLAADESFDPTDLQINVPLTQADFYGRWQKSLNRPVKRFLVYRDQEITAYFQVIKYPLVASKSYLYIPYGPVIKGPADDLFDFLKEELTRLTKTEGAVFTRLDFTPPVDQATLVQFFTPARPKTYQGAYFQPRTEWFLDLAGSADELLSAMHEKTRYSIRLASRKGVTTEIVTTGFDRYFDQFYQLLTATAGRNNFGLHPKEYYRTIFNDLPQINAYLAVARLGEKILAIDLIVIFDQVANYLFGGLANEEKNRMPAYAVKWQAILQAKELGCRSYNFGGISTDDGKYRGWDGLTVFKKKFGGRAVVHSDFFDLVAAPLWYQLYNFRKNLKSIN